MFRTILVPLDGTQFAEAALPIATRLARQGSSTLHLALSHRLVPALVGTAELAMPLTELDQELRSHEASYLAKTAENLAITGGSRAEYRELDGPPGPAVCEEAERIGADLVVIATHARSGTSRLWHGSVADYLVRHVSVPVLLVNPERKHPRLADRPVRGILVGLDGTDHSEAILGAVEALALLTMAPVTLIRILVGPDLRDHEYADAQDRIERVANRMRGRGVVVSTRVTRGVNAAWSLRDALEEAPFDILAIATHGAAGLRRMWMGSVADKVVRSASKPVLVLHPGPGAPV